MYTGRSHTIAKGLPSGPPRAIPLGLMSEPWPIQTVHSSNLAWLPYPYLNQDLGNVPTPNLPSIVAQVSRSPQQFHG